jgi:beta-lactamase regulating signal transducer with metallopeptidase domain
MSDALLGAARWLLHVAVGGGLLLLLTWLVVRWVRQPARQQRLAEWGVAASLVLAALCLMPSWLLIPLPVATGGSPVVLPQAPAESAVPPPDKPQGPQDRAEKEVPPVDVVPPLHEPAAPERVPHPQGADIPRPDSERPSLAANEPAAPFSWGSLLLAVVCLYFSGAAWMLVRLAWGYRHLARLLRSAAEAPPEVRQLFEAMFPFRRPRLLVSRLVRVPLSCGVLRPAVVLPAALCGPEARTPLRWVFAHELAHLRRRDAVACLLFGVAQAVYWFVPWLWALRRRVRLCQEYVADAAAVAEAGPPEDYAEFLLAWSAAPALPAGATGVSGQSSDLFRRITMLVKVPMKIEERCPRRWSVLAAVSLLSLAILGAGIGLRAAAPPKEVNQDENKKDKDVTKDKNKTRPRQDGFADLDDLLKRNPAALPQEHAKRLRQQMEQMRNLMEQMLRQFPNAGDFPGVPGADMPQFPQFQLPNARWGVLNNRLGRQQEPRLGVRVDKPSETLVDQLDLPKGQGLIVEDVVHDSAAAKAGLKKHDILLELDGKPVPNDAQEFARIVKDLKADTKVDAVVLRKTRKETVKGLTLPKMPEPPAPPRFGGLGGAGLSGNTTIKRSNDAFSARNQQGDLTVEVTGTIEDGKAKVDQVKITESNRASTYASLDKVPEKHRDLVNNLVEAASPHDLRFPFNRPRRQVN